MNQEVLNVLVDWVAPDKRTVIGSDGQCELSETLANKKHRVCFEEIPKDSLLLKLEDHKRGIFTFWNCADGSVCPFRKMCDGIILLNHDGNFYVIYIELKSGDPSRACGQYKSARAAWCYIQKCLELEGVKISKVKEKFILCTHRRINKKTRSTNVVLKVD